MPFWGLNWYLRYRPKKINPKIRDGRLNEVDWTHDGDHVTKKSEKQKNQKCYFIYIIIIL